MRSAKARVTTVQEALKEFYGKDPQAKQSVINKIFAAHNPTIAELKDNKNMVASKCSNGQKNDPHANAVDSSFSTSKFARMQRGSAAQLAAIRK